MKRLTSDQPFVVAVIQKIIDTVMDWFGKDPDQGAMKSPFLIIVLAIVAVMAILTLARADVVGTGPAPNPVILPVPKTPVYFHIGALNLTIPWDQVNVVYLYDLKGKRNLVGGEAVVASLWKFQGTVGAVTSLDGKGAPFIGGNMWFSNPIPQIAILNEIKPGIFGGWDWNKNAVMFGLKAAFPIF